MPGLVSDRDAVPAVPCLSKAWQESDCAEQALDVAALISSNHALGHAIAKLKNITSTHGDVFARAIADMEEAVASGQHSLRKMATTKLFNYQHGPGTSATRFFEVPELCERVLLHLGICDILAMQQVNHNIFAVIEGSRKLQRELHLLPDHEAAERSLHFGLECSDNAGDHTKMVTLDGWLEPPPGRGLYGAPLDRPTVHFEFLAPMYVDGTPPGARVRRMLLQQPPVTVLDVELECCGQMSLGTVGYGQGHAASDFKLRYGLMRDGDPLPTVTNPHGLTVGDVYDVCIFLAEAHKLCSKAPWHMHDQDGWVRPSVRFHGILAALEAQSRSRKRAFFQLISRTRAICQPMSRKGHIFQPTSKMRTIFQPSLPGEAKQQKKRKSAVHYFLLRDYMDHKRDGKVVPVVP